MAIKTRFKSDSDQPADSNDIDQTVAISRLIRVLAGYSWLNAVANYQNITIQLVYKHKINLHLNYKRLAS